MGTVLDLLLALSVVVLALVLQVQLGKSSACNWVFLHDTITIPESDKDPPIMEVHPETGVRDPTTPDFSPTNGTTRSKEPRAMSKYNVTVVEITKVEGGYTGTFTLSDESHTILRDGVVRRAQATLRGEVHSIPWTTGPIAKIRGTYNQRKGTFVPATVVGTDEVVQVDWSAGHRSAVAAAFSAAWTKLSSSGESRMENLTGLKKTSSGPTVVVNTAATKEIEDLKDILKAQEERMAAQAEQMARLMEMMAQNEAAKTKK
jgi:hypothetical protein